MAVAAKLRIIYATPARGAPYLDPQIDYSALVVKRKGPQWMCVLAQAGLLEQTLQGHSYWSGADRGCQLGGGQSLRGRPQNTDRKGTPH